MSDREISTLFVDFSREKLLNQYWPRLRGCVQSLNDEQVWWRPNDASNSIGVTERTAYILRVRQLAVGIAKFWVGEKEHS